MLFLRVYPEVLTQPCLTSLKLHDYQFTSLAPVDSLFHYSLDLIKWLKLAGSFNLNTNYSKDWCQLSFSPHSNDHIWVGSGYTSSSATRLLCFWSCQQKTHGSDMQAREQCESITDRESWRKAKSWYLHPAVCFAWHPCSLLTLPVQTAISIAGVCSLEGSGRAASQLFDALTLAVLRSCSERRVSKTMYF